MINKVSAFIRKEQLIAPHDRICCALSGGADSVALFFALYLLQEKFQFTLCAVHFNHGLRGEEAERDQAFAEELCAQYGVALYIGRAQVVAGDKGLEAAARDARYAFFDTLSEKVATAHTADDNAETVLMHLIRGSGLKGLGGIAPKRGKIIRPMLTVTRGDVVAFLQEYSLSHIEDSSNASDDFFRNRLRHRLIPLLKQENPCLSENLSQMAMRLRQDELLIEGMMEEKLPSVSRLRELHPALRTRYLRRFLADCGLTEAGAEHIALLEGLLYSDNPSATVHLPMGIILCRNYDRIELKKEYAPIVPRVLPCPGLLDLPEQGIRISCTPATEPRRTFDCFTVYVEGTLTVRCRQSGDVMRLQGGSKKLKQILIDRKIPAAERSVIPVLADDRGLVAVWGIGANLDRTEGTGNFVEIRFSSIS